MLRLQAAIRGNLKQLVRDQSAAAAKAATIALRIVARGARLDLRAAIRRNFAKGDRGRLSGAKLENTVRVKSRPERGYHINAETSTYSRATYKKRPGGIVDLVAIFDEGTTIRARGGDWLAIPTSNAPIRTGRGGARRARPSEIRRGIDLVFVPRDNGNALLVDRASGLVMYVLVRQVRLRRRIDTAPILAKWWQRLPNQILESLDKEDRRLGEKYR